MLTSNNGVCSGRPKRKAGRSSNTLAEGENKPLDPKLRDLLLKIKNGERFFRPEHDSEEGKDSFVPVVRRLKELSSRGLIEPLTERRIIKDHTTGKGHYNAVGPCELTYAGEAALEEHERANALTIASNRNNISQEVSALEVLRRNPLDTVHIRLQDLLDNITKDYALLKEYEDELRLEDEPRRRAKYQREIEKLKASFSRYEREYQELKVQVADRPREASLSERSDLQEIHAKLDTLLAGQSDINLGLYQLRQAIFSRYEAGEQRIIRAITEHLDQAQAETVEAMVTAVENNQLTETEMAETLGVIQHALSEAKSAGITVPEYAEAKETISAAKLDVKHKLKFSIPIVPLLLEYEGEVELGSGVNLESVWNRLVHKFRRK